MSKKVKELTSSEIQFISEQSGMDHDIVRSWYKGKMFLNVAYNSENFEFNLYFIIYSQNFCRSARLVK